MQIWSVDTRPEAAVGESPLQSPARPERAVGLTNLPDEQSSASATLSCTAGGRGIVRVRCPTDVERDFIMTIEEFRDCLLDYYQTEVRGEAFFASVLEKFDEPDHRYKIGSLLQLETETKARLRPTILELGGSVEEFESSRAAGRSRAASMTTRDWEEFVVVLNKVGEPLTKRQREVSEIAPPPYRELALSMKVHGESIQEFTERELAGDLAHSIDGVVSQLRFPLRRS